ncbi:MAG: PorT family protein [Hymenobacteraceae bacterium]|nr:PorT family protein [Hymenobacteraceae bacterium]
MKKPLLLLILILLYQTNLLLAQTMPGIRLGGSMSKINGISMAQGKYDWMRHYHGGLVLSHKIGDRLYLQPELIYSQKGFFYEIDRNNRAAYRDTVRYHEKTQLTYLDLPILAKVEAKGFYFEAGPQFSYYVDGKRTETRTTNSNGIITDHRHTRDMHGVAADLDIGFAAGVGYQTPLGLGLGLRYNQSFREAINRQNWRKNVVLQLSAFYLFGKRKEILAATPRTPSGYAAPDVEYFDKRKIKKSYNIISKTNMQRVTFTKVSESERTHIEFNIISTGAYTPQDVLVSGSSGNEENTGLFLGFRDVVFPFQGTIQFSTPTSVGELSLIQSRMEYEINEPGLWRITITVSR